LFAGCALNRIAACIPPPAAPSAPLPPAPPVLPPMRPEEVDLPTAIASEASDRSSLVRRSPVSDPGASVLSATSPTVMPSAPTSATVLSASSPAPLPAARVRRIHPLDSLANERLTRFDGRTVFGAIVLQARRDVRRKG
jgi:hypothetical protein